MASAPRESQTRSSTGVLARLTQDEGGDGGQVVGIGCMAEAQQEGGSEREK